MKINYDSILRDAKIKEISPYLIIKRSMNYLPIDKKNNNNCKRCKLVIESNYYNNKLFCELIGVNKDDNAIVDEDHTCNNYKRR